MKVETVETLKRELMDKGVYGYKITEQIESKYQEIYKTITQDMTPEEREGVKRSISKKTVDRLLKFENITEPYVLAFLTTINEVVGVKNKYTLINCCEPESQPLNIGVVATVKEQTLLKEIVVYYRILHLTDRRTSLPIYQKHIPRTDRTISVFDEYINLRTFQFHHDVEDFEVKIRTSGEVDLSILHPIQTELRNSDMQASFLEKQVETYISSDKQFIQICYTVVNGLQPKEDFPPFPNNDLGFKATDDVDSVRLYVDFTSLPIYSEQLFTVAEKPQASFRKPSGTVIETKYSEVRPGLFLVDSADIAEVGTGGIKKNAKIEITFPFDWDYIRREASRRYAQKSIS